MNEQTDSNRRTTKIVKAQHQVTFDKGQRQYNVIVSLDNEKQGPAYYMKNNSFHEQYRFDDSREAQECATWLIGRDYIGPRIY